MGAREVGTGHFFIPSACCLGRTNTAGGVGGSCRSQGLSIPQHGGDSTALSPRDTPCPPHAAIHPSSAASAIRQPLQLTLLPPGNDLSHALVWQS